MREMKAKVLLGALAVLVCATVRADGIDEALDAHFLSYDAKGLNTMVLDDAVARVVRADLSADASWTDAKSPSELAALRARLRAAMVAAVGGFPARTPLNAQTLAVLPRDGYRVENVLFESRPSHYVTANLYLPDGKGPFPGVVVTCGHDSAGKNAPSTQRACVLLAKGGFAAFAFDPIDQGERIQLPGSGRVSVSGHVAAGLRAHLLGWSAAQFRIWDGLRALDYLETRPEIDAKRVGVTGMSGGGTMSAYLNAVDTRYSAAAPMGYVSAMRVLTCTCGPQDAEQVIFGQLAFGLNHLSLLLMNGGSAVCPGFSRGDFFSYAGAADTLGKARLVRAAENASGRIDVLECHGPHGWYESEKQGLVLWMRRHLAGDGTAWPPDREALARADVGFSYAAVDSGPVGSPDGSVLGGKGTSSLPGSLSVYDLMDGELARLEKVRPALTPEAVRIAAGIAPPADCTATPLSERIRKDGPLTIRSLVLLTRDGLQLPLVVFRPGKETGAPVLLVGDRPRSAYAQRIRSIVSSGRPVALVELRAYGESADYGRPSMYWANKGRDREVAALLAWLGENLVSKRTEDLFAAAAYLKGVFGVSPDLVAEGSAVIPAAHARYLASGTIASLEVSRAPAGWAEQVRGHDLELNNADLVYGALKVYDWKDLLERAGPPDGRIPAVRTVPHELDVLVGTGHIQGAACTEEGIYLAHSGGIEMIGWDGRLIRRVDAPSHLGDIAYSDGRIYGAFVIRGKDRGNLPGMVRVWNSKLEKIAERRFPEALDGAVVLGKTLYVGVDRWGHGLHPLCCVKRLDLDLNDLGNTDVDLGYEMHYGVQTMATDGKDLFFGNYGGTSRVSADLKSNSPVTLACAEGFGLVPKSVSKRDEPVFFTVKPLGGNIQGWRKDPTNNPPRIEIRFSEYVNGAFRDITAPAK